MAKRQPNRKLKKKPIGIFLKEIELNAVSKARLERYENRLPRAETFVVVIGELLRVNRLNLSKYSGTKKKLISAVSQVLAGTDKKIIAGRKFHLAHIIAWTPSSEKAYFEIKKTFGHLVK